jgi:hypothetical protein
MKFNDILLGVLFVIIIGLATTSAINAQNSATVQKANSPNDSNKQHYDHVNKRGDHVMGFDHMKTTHHFRLKSDGGVIEIEVNNPKDITSKNQIRKHLDHIAGQFADGDFTAPMMIHAQTPPGVSIMKELRTEIKYTFEKTEKGGLVEIKTSNSKAIGAVHEFLKFQIEDHQTGDSLEVENLSK